MDRLYKGVWEKVRSGSVISRGLFQFAYEYKHRAIERGYEVPIMNKYVLTVADKMVSLLSACWCRLLINFANSLDPEQA